jgi:spore maturation protein SpmB
VAEESGLLKMIANSLRPITKFLFPEIPQDHPAIGAMVMNISANMLGLGNAATPFGLKAMEELDKLNPEKGTATNSMCTFLAINTAGLTLIPATAIAVRAASGSSNPAIIIGTSIFGAGCATIAGVAAAKIFEKLSGKNYSRKSILKSLFKTLAALAVLILLVFIIVKAGVFHSSSGVVSALKNVLQVISVLAIPMVILSFVIFAFIKKVKVYESFIEGAKEGFNVALKIIPYLVAMLCAIAIFRSGGGMDFLVSVLTPVTNLIGLPAEALPMAFLRPLSGSGSLGLMSEVMATHGPDSFLGVLVSTMFGSTETTFYVIALYFGSVNIKRTRHAVAAGLIADLAGMLGALFIVRLLFGIL